MRVVLVSQEPASCVAAAEYLRRHHGFKRVNLRDPIDEFIRKLHYYNQDHRRIPWHTRLRYWDALYEIEPDVLVGYVERRMRTTKVDVVTPDARYVNEVNFLKAIGYIVIRITSPAYNKRDKSKTLPAMLQKQQPNEGTVLLFEHFGKKDAYTVEYSIYNESKEALGRALDRIVELEKAKEV